MATRFIKDSIWTSPNLNELSDMAERHFYRLLPLPDDHGCCEITPSVVKGRCYPLKPSITPKMIEKWTLELEQNDIIRTWSDKGRLFAYFPTWGEHQRIRSLNKRRTPEPPASVVTCRQVPSIDRSLPSLLSSLPSSPSPLCAKAQVGGFDDFWKAYPKRVGKGQARRAWQKLQPTEQLQGQILASLERAKTSAQWAKESGRYIPNPATWLNAEGWEDEHEVDVKAKDPFAFLDALPKGGQRA